MEPHIGDAIKSELVQGFKDKGAEKFSESQWLDHLYNGSNKVRFEYCETSQKALTYIRAIQGHSGGIATDLMGHVLLPKG